MSPCPTPEQVEQFLAGDLAGPLAGEVGAHINTCGACDRMARRLAGMGPSRTGEPPEVAGYRLVRPLGAGGMGVVWEAEQVALGRRVALKLIREGALGRPELLARFNAEAKALARLSHPNIVTIYDSGPSPAGPYLAMEYLPGGSLQARLAHGHWGPLEAARLVATLARAIHVAHCVGVIHRDLKPGNVLFTAAGEAKVVDFGIAKVLDRDRELTESGQVIGSAGYLAPEQAAGRLAVIGPATDVHGLGLILYRLLAGRLPYEGGSSFEMLSLVIHEPPPPPSRFRPDLPPHLERVCLRCLAKAPEDRYATAADLADALEEPPCGDGAGPRAAPTAITTRLGPPVPTTGETGRWPHASAKRLSRPLLGAAIGLALAALIAACWALPDRDGGAPPADASPQPVEPVPLRRLALGRPRTLSPQLTRPGNSPRCLAVAPTGRHLFAGGWHEEGVLWQSGADKGLVVIQENSPGVTGNTMSATFSPDGRQLITAGEVVCVRDVESGQIVARLRGLTNNGESVVAIQGEGLPTGPGSPLVLAGDYNGTVTGWDLRSEKPVIQLALGGAWKGTTRVAASSARGLLVTARRRPFDEDCQRLAIPVPDDVLRTWDLTALAGPGVKAPREAIPLPRDWGVVTAIALAAEGDRLYVATSRLPRGTCQVAAWDLSPGGSRRRWARPLDIVADFIPSLAVSPDGRWLAVGIAGVTRDENLELWWAADGARLTGAVAHPGQGLSTVAVCPDGRQLATVSQLGVTQLWPVSVDEHPRPN